MLEMLRTELHCHNVFSNGHVGDLEPPFDCNVTVNEQLQKALDSKLDVLFVTNHNTLDGFKQMTDYKNSHEKFSNVKVYPAVEITTDKEAHVLVYGLQEEIKSSQSIDEILDAAKSQDAVTIAPHPFSLICKKKKRKSNKNNGSSSGSSASRQVAPEMDNMEISNNTQKNNRASRHQQQHQNVVVGWQDTGIVVPRYITNVYNMLDLFIYGIIVVNIITPRESWNRQS